MNIIRKTILIAAAAVTAVLAVGCAKTATAGKNDASKRYFDAWLVTHYPNVQKTYPGIYIVSDKPGTGALLNDEEAVPYVMVDYTCRSLDGDVVLTTTDKVAQQVGTYVATDYYGPKVFYRAEDNLAVGITAALNTMRVGGERKVIIPGWLSSYDRYDDEEGYLKNATGTDYIYDIRVDDCTSDIAKWEIDSLERYVRRNYGESVDSTYYGSYYVQTQECSDTTAFEDGDEVKINYIGRLLNGQVFDTTIKDTAKVYGIYSASKTYEPVKITWASEYNNLTMGDSSSTSSSSSSSMITGFSRALFDMRKGEKGTVMFYSTLGYTSSGSGNSIPPYSPLRFDFEIIGKGD